jgi:MerR family redox-sensitive transcriptional activator SoxR
VKRSIHAKDCTTSSQIDVKGVHVQSFGIGEIARRAGVAASTIRYYEAIGLLPPPERVSGKRRYAANSVETLKVIRLAQDAGFTLTEIHTMLARADLAPAQRWQLFAAHKIAELDAQIEQAQRRKAFIVAARDCACDRLETCAAFDAGM